jgi:pimeloyl-ACP methyl ester carboxylesterase
VQRTTRGQIVYHVSGEGDPLVFLHDLFPGAASYEWSKVYPHFAATHRVLAPDWIGFGESERPDRPLRAEDYAQSLLEFCRATCGGRRPVIVASGLGAALACLAAAQHPEFCARLVLFHPSGTSYWLDGWAPAAVRFAAWTKRGRRWIYANYLATPSAIARWLGGRRSAGPEQVRPSSAFFPDVCRPPLYLAWKKFVRPSPFGGPDATQMANHRSHRPDCGLIGWTNVGLWPLWIGRMTWFHGFRWNFLNLSGWRSDEG